ncbi:MAG TPA: DUF2384 domain-containing protein [Burkholderiaceae bacterium]|nr:DUF2384 domain-containing protein [Burkholderiaceae bacterium]
MSMSPGDPVPRFERDFSHFLDYLHDDQMPTSISPKRFAKALGMDLQTFAIKSQMHHDALCRTPTTERVQHRLRESLRVLRAAIDRTSNVEKAVFWFKNISLSAFDDKTALDLVAEGRTEALICYIQSLEAGFIG